MSRSNTNNDNTSRISGHIRDLLTHFLPADSPTQVFEGYQKYVLNILSSRIPAPNLDENTLRTNILKKVEKNDQENSITTKQKRDVNSAKVNELFQRLARLKVFKNRFSTCYLLWKISKENEKVAQPVQGVSALETAILSKQQAVTANRINRGGMEVENQAPSNYGRGGTSGSLLRRTEPKENILKIVHQISNKGNANIDVSENDLLRDILFAFQGIDGNYILFSSQEDRYTIKPTISLSEPVRKMVLGLCEMGWLYRKLFGFMNQIQNEAQGLVYQTLCDAIKQELDEYYRLIAMLESLRDADDEQSRSSFLVENKPAEKSLSLRKLALWSIEPMERLRWMCIVCDACRNSKGGTIISSITSYGKQGSPSIQALVNRILKKVLAPFSNFLYQWVYKGELVDEHQEFFITMDPYVKDDHLWANRYSLRKEMIPAFMEFELAEKILKTGKSVNFLKKYGGLLNEWNLNIPYVNLGTNLETEDNINQPLNYAEWEEWAIKSYEVTSKTLLSVMFEKFSIMTHYETIKKFLLFAQGDFIQYLMDLLVNELVKPASTLYKHNLTSFLETALRASNAQHISPEILARVDVKLLDASPGDNGWDIFSLTYNVDAPLTTVISAKTMTGYLRLFNIFWRIKRIENSLSGIWVQHMKSARLVEKMPEYRMHFRKVNILRNEMFHFIENLLNYLLIEVVQSEWENFVEKLKKPQDLDEVIGLHEEYVNSMLEKALLTVRSEKIYKQMLKIFDLIGRFKSTQEIMTSSIQEELYKKTSGIDRSYITETAGNDSSLFLTDKLKDNRTLDLGIFGGGGGNTARTAMKRETMISLKNIGKDYKDAFLGLMELLRDDALAGKLRFLTFRLDFNEYYTSINPNNVSLRDRDIEDFRAGYNNRPSFQTMIIEKQPNRNSAWNRNEIKRPGSIPKREEPSSSKMIIEEPAEISKDKTLPLDHGQSFNLSHTQEPFKSGFLKTIDLDTSQQQAGLPPNLSDIRQKFDRLTTLLGQTMNKGTEGNTSVSKIGGDSGIYLKSLNFGDEPKEKKE